MKAIVIDDEKQMLFAFKELLSNHHPDVQILASGQSVEEGYQIIRQHHPDVVFLDIELPDGLGFDVLQRIGQPDFQVVFVTAHNEYALTAIKFGALDYLLKPVSPEDLAVSIKRVQDNIRKKISEEQIQILFETLQNFERKALPSRIAISTSKGIIYRQVKNIVRLQAQQNFTEFFIWDQSRSILASLNIGAYSEQFERYREFMQVHRSHLVNLCFVDTFIKTDGGYLLMKDGCKVSVSRAYRDELLERLAQI